MYMLVGIFRLNNIKPCCCLYHVLINIAGYPENRTKERFFLIFFHNNQCSMGLVIMSVILFYYYGIICDGINYNLKLFLNGIKCNNVFILDRT